MKIVDRVTSPEFGRIVILNGASSSGKTSISKLMQRQLKSPHHHLQLDAFLGMEPPAYWVDWKSRPDVAARQIAALCRAMNAAISEYSRNGLSVIFDTVLSSPESRIYMLTDLANLPVYLVGVSCSPEELARREKQRGDREPGLAVNQSSWIHTRMRYDFEIDSTNSSPDDCAAKVVDWLEKSPEQHAFSAMRAEFDIV